MTCNLLNWQATEWRESSKGEIWCHICLYSICKSSRNNQEGKADAGPGAEAVQTGSDPP